MEVKPTPLYASKASPSTANVDNGKVEVDGLSVVT